MNGVKGVANRLPEPPKKHLWSREAAGRTCASNPSVLDAHRPFSVSLFPGQGHVCSSPDTSMQMISNAMAIIDNVCELDALRSGPVNSNHLVQQLSNSVQDHTIARPEQVSHTAVSHPMLCPHVKYCEYPDGAPQKLSADCKQEKYLADVIKVRYVAVYCTQHLT